MADPALMHRPPCDLRLSKLFDILACDTKLDISSQGESFRKDALTHLPPVARAQVGAKVAKVEAPMYFSIKEFKR